MDRFVTCFVEILLKLPRKFESNIQAQGTSSHHHWSPTDPISSSQNPTSGASPGSAGSAGTRPGNDASSTHPSVHAVQQPTAAVRRVQNAKEKTTQKKRTSNFNTAKFCCLNKNAENNVNDHTEIFWSVTCLHHLTPCFFVGRICFCFFCIRHVSERRSLSAWY